MVSALENLHHAPLRYVGQVDYGATPEVCISTRDLRLRCLSWDIGHTATTCGYRSTSIVPTVCMGKTCTPQSLHVIAILAISAWSSSMMGTTGQLQANPPPKLLDTLLLGFFVHCKPQDASSLLSRLAGVARALQDMWALWAAYHAAAEVVDRSQWCCFLLSCGQL